MQRDDIKKLIEQNKARKAVGLSEIKVTKANCLKCGQIMQRVSNYRCDDCLFLLSKISYSEEVFDRQYIFNSVRDKRYKELVNHYKFKGLT
jgi:hypothetical protein